MEDVFVAQGEVVKFDGFLRVYKETEGDSEADNEMTSSLPILNAGETLHRSTLTATQRFAQHPVRYNEASLVRKLEELGIGRPSTYAATITTIQQRDYVNKGDKPGEERLQRIITLENDELKHSENKTMVGAERGKLLPTDIGIVVNDFLQENFPEIMDYNFTADIEKEFDISIIGERRIWSISQHIRTEYKKYGAFHEGYGPRGEAASPDAPTDAAKPVSEADEIKQLRHEVDYLKQEMEFLKKISSIRTTRK